MLENVCHVDFRDQFPRCSMSTGERPLNAARIECAPLVSTPEVFNISFIHLLMVDFETALWGFIKLRKSCGSMACLHFLGNPK